MGKEKKDINLLETAKSYILTGLYIRAGSKILEERLSLWNRTKLYLFRKLRIGVIK